MTDAAAIAVAARVQAAFERVHRERMSGLPFVNGALRVEVVGLRRWRGLWLGALVTPWFMNLLLLPGDGATEDGEIAAQWPQLATGEYAQFTFPAGEMSFLGGREGEAGEYLSCSLFSPMFEFAGHDDARATAEACLLALLDPDAAAAQVAAESTPPPPMRRREFLSGRREPAAPSPES
jgi:[NiFe] hydrogenase assembly HybE family chaperone